jgi:hypothetical protein
MAEQWEKCLVAYLVEMMVVSLVELKVEMLGNQ